MVQAALTCCIYYNLRLPECRIQAFYSEDTPSPTFNYCFPFGGSCFFYALFYHEGNGGLDGKSTYGSVNSSGREKPPLLSPGAVFFLNIPGIFDYTPSAIPTCFAHAARTSPQICILWGTAPGSLADCL
jgi:hypothetical protein